MHLLSWAVGGVAFGNLYVINFFFLQGGALNRFYGFFFGSLTFLFIPFIGYFVSYLYRLFTFTAGWAGANCVFHVNVLRFGCLEFLSGVVTYFGFTIGAEGGGVVTISY